MSFLVSQSKTVLVLADCVVLPAIIFALAPESAHAQTAADIDRLAKGNPVIAAALHAANNLPRDPVTALPDEEVIYAAALTAAKKAAPSHTGVTDLLPNGRLVSGDTPQAVARDAVYSVLHPCVLLYTDRPRTLKPSGLELLDLINNHGYKPPTVPEEERVLSAGPAGSTGCWSR
jgi:hypothetical protein